MPPKRQTVSEEAFQTFKREVERNSQLLVQQLLKKIEDIQESCDEKIKELKKEIRELDNRNQNNMTHVEEHNIRNSNIEISKPTFYGNQKDQHPIDFLQNLEEYFKIKQISREERLIVIRDCLKNAANNWYSTIKFQIRTYSEFRDAFIDEFWSREIQIQTWSGCLNTSHIPSNTTYREHFSQWASRLRHLQVPQLSEEEIVKNIANHYPGYIRAILVSLPEKSIVNAMKVLSTEENRKEVPETVNTENNTNNQPQRNDNWRNSGGERNPRRDQPRNNWNGQPQHNNNSYPQRNWNQRGQQRENGSNQPQVNQVNVDATVEVNERNDNPHTSHAVNSIPTNNRIISPYIQCEIEGESMQLLVDTGATISVLTKEIVDRIIQNNNHVPMLPISGVQISNAVGKKICKLSKQIFCECKLGPVTIFANFVQVENLNEKGIIGADVLRQYNTQIDFSNRTVTWNVNQTLYQTPFANIEPKVITKDHQMNRIQINSSDDEHNQHLGNEQRLEFAQLLDRYQHIFSDRPGKIEQYQCRIKVKEGEPVYQRPYPIPMSKVAKMDLEIQRMLEWGIIEKSTSPWSSPIVGVEKKNGDIRVCIDARKINQRIIPDRECPSNIEEILLKFEGAQYLSSIDLTAGYWQCPLQQECREVTAFLYRGRNYQYKVLPFGLVNSIAEFQKILDKVLGPEILNFVAIYVDDIHIMSKSFSEHLEHLSQIFQKFSEHNITINASKSHFFQSQVLFLGHVISKDGIKMDPNKVKAVQNFQPPQNRKQVQAFLGFINFYRKYIRDLSEMTSRLSELLKKETPWRWTDQHQVSFMEIKRAFLEDIIIQYPDFQECFYLSTDASRTAIGAELFQLDKDGKHRTLGFISRTLKAPERNYHTTELELLAIVFACKKFRNHILGYPIKVLTDHKALEFLKQCQLLNARLTRWSISLQEFNLEIIHVPGKENIGADTLTRYPQGELDFEQQNHINVVINKLMVHPYSHELQSQFKHLSELQRQDPKLHRIIGRLQNKPDKYFIIHRGLLFSVERDKSYRVMIPDVMSVQLITETHTHFGHMGAYKTYHLLRSNYRIRNMYARIKRFTRSCELCQKSKVNNQTARGPTISTILTEPKHTISLDLMGPLPRGQLGMKYILALVDIFSKHVKLYAIRRANTDTILSKVLHDYLPNHGPVKRILTDNGTQFTSSKWTEQLQKIGVKASFTTIYHPESNPVERVNREIGRILRTYCSHKHTTWVKWLDNIEYWLNNTTHQSTGFTPTQILTGKKPSLSIDKFIPLPVNEPVSDLNVIIQLAKSRLQKRAEQRNRLLDKKRKFPTYQVGQQVLVKEHKLSSSLDKEIHKFFLLYRGPYTISQVHDNNTLVITDDQGKPQLQNFKNVKLYVPPDPGKTEASRMQ